MSEAPRRVVVTGLGVVCPVGNDVETAWQAVITGTNGVGPIRGFDPSGIASRIAGEVKDFEPTCYMDKRAARRMDPYARYAVAAARQAVEHAELDVAAEAEGIGAIMASGVGGLTTFQEQTRVLQEKGPDRVNPLFIPMMIPNMGAAHVSLELGAKGPVSAVCTACAAGGNAIGDAFEIVRRGDAVAMIAGGSEAPVNETGVAAFSAMRALSTRNDDPEHASRPFDVGRDGFIIAEGAGALILEDRDHALARGATIHAEVVGYGLSADAFHLTQPDDTGGSQARAMTLALQQAGMMPSQVDYVNAHGTSTVAGDVSEVRAMKIAFGDRAGVVPISSTKSMTGHMLGGTGAVEAVFSVLAIERGIIPPTINLTDPDPECDLDFVPGSARQRPVRVAMSNSFGFGGHNVSLVFRAYA